MRLMDSVYATFPPTLVKIFFAEEQTLESNLKSSLHTYAAATDKDLISPPTVLWLSVSNLIIPKLETHPRCERYL